MSFLLFFMVVKTDFNRPFLPFHGFDELVAQGGRFAELARAQFMVSDATLPAATLELPAIPRTTEQAS